MLPGFSESLLNWEVYLKYQCCNWYPLVVQIRMISHYRNFMGNVIIKIRLIWKCFVNICMTVTMLTTSYGPNCGHWKTLAKRGNSKKVNNSPSHLFENYKVILLNSIKARVFFGKNIEEKHLCCHDKNYYYFWKSYIPVINLIVDSRNMIKVSKNMRL